MPDWLAILKAYIDTLETIVGTEGGVALANKLTAARAGYLDNINNAQLLQISAARLGYIDLLADAGVGLAALEALVDDLETAVGAIEGATTLHNKLTAARAALLDQITALRLAELDAANLPADIDTLIARLTAVRAGYLDFESRILEVSITAAANAGVTTVATVATQPCQIESIVIHADAAQTGDMTTCAVKGGAGQAITFISTTDATQANLNAADKQVAWTGAVRLAATKTIIIDLQGTGATAVDLTIVIKYRACVAGGGLS